MNRLAQIVEKYEDVDFSINKISPSELELILQQNGLKVGSQLRAYILDYGYLGRQSVEFYGVNSIQKDKSDLFVQTEYLHKYFDKTKNLVAFESKGEGEYVLIDENDEMWLFESEGDDLKKLGQTLIDYIEQEFDAV